MLNQFNQNPHMISGFSSKFNESLDQSEDLLQNTLTELDQSSKQDLNQSDSVLVARKQKTEQSNQVLQIEAEESIEQKL